MTTVATTARRLLRPTQDLAGPSSPEVHMSSGLVESRPGAKLRRPHESGMSFALLADRSQFFTRYRSPSAFALATASEREEASTFR
jgi:hypothetical protein